MTQIIRPVGCASKLSAGGSTQSFKEEPSRGVVVTRAEAAPAETARARDGLAFLRAMMDGRLPGPAIGTTLGFTLAEVGPGRAVFEMTPTEAHYNPLGTVHGGVFATLLDSAAGCATHSLLPVGVGYTSLDLTVKFLRPITVRTVEAGPLRCIGTVTHLGTRTALAQAELRGPDDKLHAHAVSSLLIIRP
jgi:uncharacterized protein (TIGR00369 family)